MVAWKQATSYCEMLLGFLEFCGWLPAYFVPAKAVGPKGEPFELSKVALPLPGVDARPPLPQFTIAPPASGWPGAPVKLWTLSANANPPAGTMAAMEIVT